MTIQLVCWDVHGTLIAPHNDEVRDDVDSEPLRLRDGALECLAYLRSKDITQVTCSDSDLGNLKRDLKKVGIETGFFNDLFQMPPHQPKDFTYIKEEYGKEFGDILVIGDNYGIDLKLAAQQGCRTLHVPESSGRIKLEGLMRIIE